MRIPDNLEQGPFTVAEAEAAGLTRAMLRSSRWRRLGRGFYACTDVSDDPLLELRLIARRLPAGSAFSHLTAATLHGLDVDRGAGADVTVPAETRSSARAGLHIHRGRLDPGDVCQRSGLPTTTPVRTIYDLSRTLTLVEAVVVADAALHQGLIRLHTLRSCVERHIRNRGMPRAKRVLDLAEPRTESPMETRLRVVLALGGLPRPEAQVTLRAGQRFLGRPDLLYRAERLCIEYDGDAHRTSLAADNLRQNRLVNAGYELLRYTATDVYGRPDEIVAEVRAALHRRRAGAR